MDLPRAPAVGGGAARAPAPRVRIAVQRPGAERARRLRERIAPATEQLPVPGGPSEPLLREAPASQRAGHLSYSALGSYADCGYRFYAERILGLASPGKPEARTLAQ